MQITEGSWVRICAMGEPRSSLAGRLKVGSVWLVRAVHEASYSISGSLNGYVYSVPESLVRPWIPRADEMVLIGTPLWPRMLASVHNPKGTWMVTYYGEQRTLFSVPLAETIPYLGLGRMPIEVPKETRAAAEALSKQVRFPTVSHFPSTCLRCGAPAYEGLFSAECSRKFLCGVRSPTTTPQVRKLLKKTPMGALEIVYQAELPGEPPQVHPTREGAIALWHERNS